MKSFLLCVVVFLAACSDAEDGSPANTAGTGGSPAGTGGGAGTGGASGGSGGTGGANGGASGATSDALCGVRPGRPTAGTEVLRFENEAEGVVAQIVRREEGQAPGESRNYVLDGFALVRDGATHCVTDAGALSYSNTHHNWGDKAGADVAGTSYELALTFIPGSAWDIQLRAPNVPTLTMTKTGGPFACFHCPAPLHVYVAEVMPNNTSTYADEAGDYDPWIELFNPSSEAIELTGWYLSNDFSSRKLWKFPATIIPRHGSLVVVADGETSEGPLHTSFVLSAEGGEFILTTPEGASDGGATYGQLTADQSLIADFVQSSYFSTDDPTPGARNPNID